MDWTPGNPNDLSNGKWEDNPIHLVVISSSLRLVHQRLGTKSYGHGLGINYLLIRKDGGERDGVVRVSWKMSAWYSGANLVEEMDAVRLHLETSGLDVCWAPSAAPLHKCGTFTLEPARNLASPNTAAVIAVHDFCRYYKHRIEHLETTLRDGNIHIRVHLENAMSPELLATQTSADCDFFTERGFSTKFRRSSALIPIKYPTVVASPGFRSNMEDKSLRLMLLRELEHWVHTYNQLHGTHEYLKNVGGGRMAYFKAGLLATTPSSLGLAEFIAKQKPRVGRPYELAYHLNSKSSEPEDYKPNSDHRKRGQISATTVAEAKEFVDDLVHELFHEV